MAYTPGDTLIVAQMECQSGLPADRIINTFAFKELAGIPSEPALLAMFDLVDDFFSSPTTGGDSVGEFISSWVDRAQTHTLVAYRIQAGGTGSPIAEIPWLGPSAVNGTRNMPSECSAVLSFHADLTGIQEEAGATRPKSRRRGRVFIGPLRDSAVTNDFDPKVDPQFSTTLRQAAVRMKDASAVFRPWCVWSRSDETLRPVVAGWTDNALDTQRRRGPAPTSRIVWGP